MAARIPALTLSGGRLSEFGGFKAVRQYRVWIHPPRGGDDYYYVYKKLSDAVSASKRYKGAEKPLAVVYDPRCKRYREVMINIRPKKVAKRSRSSSDPFNVSSLADGMPRFPLLN